MSQTTMTHTQTPAAASAHRVRPLLGDSRGRHNVPTARLADAIGERIAEDRHWATVATNVLVGLHHYGISDGSTRMSADTIAGRVATALASTSLDDGGQTASDVVANVLFTAFGTTVSVTAWVNGERIFRNGHEYVLTGHSCPACGINPEAYGRGGDGARCLNDRQCPHWAPR